MIRRGQQNKVNNPFPKIGGMNISAESRGELQKVREGGMSRAQRLWNEQKDLGCLEDKEGLHTICEGKEAKVADVVLIHMYILLSLWDIHGIIFSCLRIQRLSQDKPHRWWIRNQDEN